jgi:hypothetical protein
VDAARKEAERKLQKAQQDWSMVEKAHDELATWIEQALRGNR